MLILSLCIVIILGLFVFIFYKHYTYEHPQKVNMNYDVTGEYLPAYDQRIEDDYSKSKP